jgi:hypothetical protein
MQWMAMQIAVALVVGSLLLGCAKPVGLTRPDGTPFESHAELMRYLEEHPEEKARIDPQGRLTTEGEPNMTDPEDLLSRITVERDDYEKVTKVRAPPYGGSAARTMLRAWRRDGALASTTYQLYVSSRYGGDHWRFYNRAYDSDGQQLPLTKISSDVRCHRYDCAYFEDVGLEVTESYLQAHAMSGIRIQISGPGGHERFTLPPAYVAAFLQKTAATLEAMR